MNAQESTASRDEETMIKGMTLSQKILARKSVRKHIEPHEFVLIKVDLALANDITAPLAIKKFLEAEGKRVFDPEQIILVPDHFVPNKDIRSAEQAQLLRKFAKDQDIHKFFEVGRAGIEHVMLPEQGIVKSGDLVIGADSHTCTYGALGAFATGVGSTDIAGVFFTGEAWFRVPESIKVRITGRFRPYVSGKDLILKLIATLGTNGANYKALEFCGPGIENISIEGRMTIANMSVECGAKAGIFPVDDLTVAYEKKRNIIVEKMTFDDHAVFSQTVEMEIDRLKPQVAYPFSPANSKDVDVAEKEKITIQQSVIGSCTNGRIEDLRMAAAILKGKKVHPEVRCLIIPGSQRVYAQALKEGLLDIFIASECAVSTPTCGPCLGGHMGVLGEGERAISTTNRNFKGRMGHTRSEVFLASPAVAAASAVAGSIIHPENV